MAKFIVQFKCAFRGWVDFSEHKTEGIARKAQKIMKPWSKKTRIIKQQVLK